MSTAKKSLKDYSSLHDLTKLKQNELVDLCNEFKIDTKGKKKHFLIGNLIKHFPKVTEEDLNKFGANELKEFCQANDINTKGNKKDYIAKLLAWKEGKPIPEPAPTEKRKREPAAAAEKEGAAGAGTKKPKIAADDMKPIKVVIAGKEHELQPISQRTFTGWKMERITQNINNHDFEIKLEINAKK